MRKILIICTSFSPENVISAIRITKLVKYLVRLDCDITVISPEVDDNAKIDNTLIADELNAISHFNVPYSNYFSKILFKRRNKILSTSSTSELVTNNKHSIKSYFKAKFYRLVLKIYTFLRTRDWMNQVIKYIKSNDLDIEKYDIVFSSYPNISTHLIAEHLSNKQIAHKWIADFRDPIAYKSLNSPITYWRNKKHQKKICKKADAITYVTEEMFEKLSKDVSNKKKFFYLPNGFDEDDMQFVDNSNVNLGIEYKNSFKIAYAGGLYGGKRDLSILFETLKTLIDLKKIEIDKVKFLYAGKEFSVLVEQARKFNIQDILVNMGYVTREDSLSIQNQSDLIIVNTWNTKEDQGLVTGKIYECFLLKKPTLAIINGDLPNSELGKMVTKAGLGFSFETMVQDPLLKDKLNQFIFSIYEASMNNSPFQLSLNTAYIEGFNYRNATDKLIRIMNSLQ